MTVQPSQQDYENCGTRLTTSQPAPNDSEGIISAKDSIFLYISRITSVRLKNIDQQ
jgi:hypothetical protein